MASKRDRARRNQQASKASHVRFRARRIERLEARLTLHDGEDGPWLDHMLDDNAVFDATAVNPPVTAPLAAAQPQDAQPSTVGQWSPLETWPIEFINAIMLPTGKVLGYDRTFNMRLWDPATDKFSQPASPGYNFFCTGTSLLSDGTVLVTGGAVVDTVGLPYAAIYNPFTDSWTQLGNMNAGRWYPSSTTLANGDALILSGDTNGNVTDPLPEVYDSTTGTWRDLTTAIQTLPFYPRTFSAPNGDAFVAGPQALSQYLDVTGTGSWISVAERIDPDRNFGSAVMYAPGKILYVGGGSPASNSAEVIDLNDPNPTWREVSPMAFARRNCNATLLPDGEVLVVGGNDGSGTYDGNDVMAAEIWNPQTETFTTLSNMSDIRWYHSTALLLPDGRVLSTSGDNHLTGQVFSPPYLFQGTPPTITSAPGTVDYGDNFFVATPDAATITNVHWIRLGSATHAQDWDQYAQDANFTVSADGTGLNVSAPPTADASPPGYYYLFVLRGNVPSLAKIIKVGTDLPEASITGTSATEGPTGTTTNAVFTVSLSLSSAKTVTVAYATANGTATAGTDYTPVTGVLTFNPLQTTQTVTVPILNDGVFDPNELFTVNLSAPVNAELGIAQAQGLIRDFNSLPVLQIKGATVVKDDTLTTNANFVVTLSVAPTTTPVTVVYTTADGTGTAPHDYTAQTGTLTFNPGVTQQTVVVPVSGNTTDEPNNTFFVQLSAPQGAALDTAQAQGLIYNQAAPPTVHLGPTASVVEPAPGTSASMIITATLSQASGKTVILPWVTSAEVTAVAGRNFVSQLGQVTFAPGTTVQTFTVTVLGDGVKEPNETFHVYMQSEVVNGNYGNRDTVCTIIDSDTTPAISISKPSVTEGNTGTTPAVFTVSLTAAVTQAVMVAYQTSAGTATAGTDYTEAAGIVTFAAGQTTKTITVMVKGDTLAESNETFNLTLTNPVGATLASNKSVGTIVDNDTTLVPPAPTNVILTAGFASIRITWDPVPGATSYRVYRGTSPNGEGTVPIATGLVATGVMDNGPLNTGLVNGQTYYYWVTAVNGTFESSASTEVSVAPESYDFSAGFNGPGPDKFTERTANSSAYLSLNGLNIENTATFGSGLQLTDGGTNQADSAFTLLPVNVSRFTTQFTFQQFPSFLYTDPLADGMTFTIQGDDPTALGTAGGGLGYAGIAKSVAVKFDLFDNDGEGNNSTGLYTNGVGPSSLNSIDLTPTGIDLHSGHTFSVSMTYDGTTLVVTILDTVTQATATQSYTVDIPTIVGSNMAFVGFTGATGGFTATQRIQNWTYTPAPTAPTTLAVTSGASTPVNLSWTNTDINATSVAIERKTGAAGTYAQIGTTTTAAANTFVDPTAQPGTTYTYRVRALNNGSPSTYSNEVTVTTTAAAPGLSFPNGFAGAGAQFSLNGTPAKIVGTNLQITDGGTVEAASAFALTPQNISSFTTQFNLQQLGGTTPTADGMTFTIQGTAPTAVGDPGGGLGYAGIANSVSIKFDLFDNNGEGPNSTGLYTNGAGPSSLNSTSLVGTGIDLHSGHVINVAMNYNGTTLQVTLTDTVTQAQATQTYTVNIPAIVGGNAAYVGFTGGTGGLTAVQNVLNWTFSPTVAATTTDLKITNTDAQTAAVAGSPITYTIVVTNAGPGAVTGASVADVLPATLTGATFTATATGGATGFTAAGTGNIADTVNLPIGSTITYLVQATVGAAATGTLVNTATVTAPAGVTDSAPANNSATDTDTLTQSADLQITNTDGQATTVAGSLVTYTIVVSNAGPSNVTGATVADTLPATLTGVTYTATATGGATGFTATGTGNIANTVTLPAGSTITYVVKGTVSPAATGTLVNTATVTAPVGVTEITAANNTATDTDTLTKSADLQITNTDGQAAALAGSLVTYTVVVTNAGPSNVTGATVADTLPATLTGVTYTATATGGATGFTATGTGNIANTLTLPVASTVTYIVKGTLSAAATGTLANTATITAPAGVTEVNAANNTATDTDTITPQADLQVTNTDGVTTAIAGSAVTYTVVVKNAGPSAVTGATVTDTFPATLTGVTYTATATGGATGFTATGTGNIANTVTMPSGSIVTYVVHGTISPAATGTLVNTATVAVPAGATDPTPANNSATDTDTLTKSADLQITNTDGVTTLAAGALTTYTIVVTNAGPSAVTGATVADTFPATLTGVTYTATATGGATGFTASGTGNIANTVNLPAASTITYVVKGTVSPAATGTLVNTATVTAPAGVTEINAANNTATDTDTLTKSADLQITDTDGQTTAAPGALVTYTIVVTNAGPSNVTGATVADTLPATLTGVTYTATATGGATGFTATGTGNIANTLTLPAASTVTYIVKGTLSQTATGTLTNTATVTAPAGVTEINTANNTATDADTIAKQADLQITNTDGQTTVAPGSLVTYTIVVSNAGPSNVTGATVADTLPATLTGVTYTATATGGATGFTATGTGNIANTLTLPAASTVTYVVKGTLGAAATGTLSNTATITAPAGVTDANLLNNTATDSDTISVVPVINFPTGFAGAASQFAFNGTTAAIVGTNLQVTSATATVASSIYARTAVNVAQFTTSFNFQQLNGTNPSADGMTFTIQNTGLTALGTVGGGLGYSSITNSVAVKFDLFDNGGEGPNSTGLYTNGSSLNANSVNLTGTGIDLHSGHTFNATLVYDGTTLQVTIKDLTTLATATQSYTVNIPALVGGTTAFVGFTGATGGLTATQNILSWTYTATSAAPAALPAALVAMPASLTAPSAPSTSVVTPTPAASVTPVVAKSSAPTSTVSPLIEAVAAVQKSTSRPKATQAAAHDAAFGGGLRWLLGSSF